MTKSFSRLHELKRAAHVTMLHNFTSLDKRSSTFQHHHHAWVWDNWWIVSYTQHIFSIPPLPFKKLQNPSSLLQTISSFVIDRLLRKVLEYSFDSQLHQVPLFLHLKLLDSLYLLSSVFVISLPSTLDLQWIARHRPLFRVLASHSPHPPWGYRLAGCFERLVSLLFLGSLLIHLPVSSLV